LPFLPPRLPLINKRSVDVQTTKTTALCRPVAAKNPRFTEVGKGVGFAFGWKIKGGVPILDELFVNRRLSQEGLPTKINFRFRFSLFLCTKALKLQALRKRIRGKKFSVFQRTGFPIQELHWGWSNH